MTGGNLRDKAYEHLRNEIVSGRIASGAVLSEATVASALGISRTPVGEAVRQLVNEGFLEQVPRFGTVVRQIDRSEVIEHYEMREALETFAAGLAAERATAAEIDRIRELCDASAKIIENSEPESEGIVGGETLRNLLTIDMAFHLTIVQAARNRRMADTIFTSRSIGRLFSLRSQHYEKQIFLTVLEQHRQIAAAIAAHQPTSASSTMLEHIQWSRRQMLAKFEIESHRQADAIELPAEVQNSLSEIEKMLSEMGPPRTFPGRAN